jgi:hypothetical protein
MVRCRRGRLVPTTNRAGSEASRTVLSRPFRFMQGSRYPDATVDSCRAAAKGYNAALMMSMTINRGRYSRWLDMSRVDRPGSRS